MLTRDYFDWQNKQVFDPSRTNYSGEVQDRMTGDRALSSDVYGTAMYHWAWFGSSANTMRPIASNVWQQLFPPGTADFVLTHYPVAWRDKVRQIQGTLIDGSLGIRIPWDGVYRMRVDMTHDQNPTAGGAMTFTAAGFFYSIGSAYFSPCRMHGALNSQIYVGCTYFAQLGAGGILRPAWFGSSVGNNGTFAFRSIAIEVECLRQV